MDSQSKKIAHQKSGLGKCTVTKSQGKWVAKEIFTQLSQNKFKNTEDLKVGIIKLCNEFHVSNPLNSKKVTKMPKSTFYDFLNEFKIPTPLQYRKQAKEDFELPSESTVNEEELINEENIKGNGILAHNNFDSSTDITSGNPSSYDNNYTGDTFCGIDFQFVELDSPMSTDATSGKLAPHTQPQVEVPIHVNFSSDENFESSYTPEVCKPLKGLLNMKSDSSNFFNKPFNNSCAFNAIDGFSGDTTCQENFEESNQQNFSCIGFNLDSYISYENSAIPFYD